MTGPPVLDAPPPAPDRRGRILDTALAIVSERGAAGTSMRSLAAACGLNVATIYHYFPSKADLLRALIEEQRYGERMAMQRPPLDRSRPPAERLAALARWVVGNTLEEHDVLRLLVGEGMRGDPTARRSTVDLLTASSTAMTAWVTEGFPELGEPGPSPEAVAGLLRSTVLAAAIEYLVTGSSDIEARAAHLAEVAFP